MTRMFIHIHMDMDIDLKNRRYNFMKIDEQNSLEVKRTLIEVDIVCPLYNAENFIEKLHQSIINQKGIIINNLIYILTESTDESESILMNLNINYQKIKIQEYSHSLTREWAIKELCTSNNVIMISQDVEFYNDTSIYELARVINNNEAQFAFGKQVSKLRNIERYTRKFNYPDNSYIMSKQDIDKYQLRTFFASDAFSAYNRDIFIKLNGYDNKNLTFSEDMYYGYKIIMNDYKIAYVSSAVVFHSHKMSLKEVYRRYYKTGQFFRDNKYLLQFKPNSQGIKMFFKILWNALAEFNLYVVIMLIPDMLTRYIAKRRGLKSSK